VQVVGAIVRDACGEDQLGDFRSGHGSVLAAFAGKHIDRSNRALPRSLRSRRTKMFQSRLLIIAFVLLSIASAACAGSKLAREARKPQGLPCSQSAHVNGRNAAVYREIVRFTRSSAVEQGNPPLSPERSEISLADAGGRHGIWGRPREVAKTGVSAQKTATKFRGMTSAQVTPNAMPPTPMTPNAPRP
jgi:hypothetical protein